MQQERQELPRQTETFGLLVYPYYVGGIWVGNDNVQMKLSGDSGNNARLWSAIMTPIHEGLEPATFTRSPNLIPISVCAQSGKLPGDLCAHDQRGSQIITEYFIPGTQPTETCDVHVKAEVCNISLMLKSHNCPGNVVEDRVFVVRDPYMTLTKRVQLRSNKTLSSNIGRQHYFLHGRA